MWIYIIVYIYIYIIVYVYIYIYIYIPPPTEFHAVPGPCPPSDSNFTSAFARRAKRSHIRPFSAVAALALWPQMICFGNMIWVCCIYGYIYIYGYWYMGSLHEKCGMWFCSEKYMGSILEQTDFAKKNLARLLEIWEPIETLESAMVNKCCSTTIGNCDQPEIFGTCGDFTSIDWSIFIPHQR